VEKSRSKGESIELDVALFLNFQKRRVIVFYKQQKQFALRLLIGDRIAPMLLMIKTNEKPNATTKLESENKGTVLKQKNLKKHTKFVLYTNISL
jgi:hypothetical protein